MTPFGFAAFPQIRRASYLGEDEPGNLTAKYGTRQFNRQNHLRVGVRACGTVRGMHEGSS
jgi:hypothetical protein